MRQGHRWLLNTLVTLSFFSLTVLAQPLAPVREWDSPLDQGRDVAWAVDISPIAIAVAGNQGVVIYDQGGEIRSFIRTVVPQHAVLFAGDRFYVGGEGELTAYTLTGERLWTRSLEGSCTELALTDDSLLALVGGKLLRFSLSGARRPSPTIEPGLTALAAGESTVVVAKGTRVRAVGQHRRLWTRTLPHEVVDLAVDKRGDVWAVEGSVLTLLSGRTGAVIWTRRLPAELTAVAYPKAFGEPALPLEWAVVAGHAPSPAGDRDYWLAGISREGEIVWRALYDSDHGDDLAYGVAATVSGTIVVTGSATCVVSDASQQDYLTVKYSLMSPGVGGIVGLTSSPPVADFECEPASPLTFDQVRFVNRSHDPDGMIVAYEWRLGDSTQAYTENAQHAYLRPGEYPVTLTVVDDDGQVASCTKLVPVGNRPPEAEWEASVEGTGGELTADFSWQVVPEQHGAFPWGFVPDGITDLDEVVFQDLSTSQAEAGEVRFTDLSQDWDGEVVAWHWEFGDGTESDEREPSHRYPGPGIYHVVLTVTDDAGATGVHEGDVEIGPTAGEIVAWHWEFGDGTESDEREPSHWFQDDGVYEVTLTVQDEFGNSDSVTKEIWVGNVPPTAEFAWSYLWPEGFLPDCFELMGGGALEPDSWEGPPPEEGSMGVACQEPELPAEAGLVEFHSEAFDSDGQVEEWGWQWHLAGYGECWEEEDCHLSPDPLMFFLSGEGEFLYRGEVETTLRVWDDDGAGGNDYPSSHITDTVPLANIPPYAAFEWQQDEWASWTELSCSACGDVAPQATGGNAQVTVTRTVYSWDCGGEGGSAVVAPWGGAGVELILEGTGTVEIRESLSPGWDYWVMGDDCVTITEQGEGYWTATVDLDACEGYVSIWYDLYPPYEGPTGAYSIQGAFTTYVCDEGGCTETGAFTVESELVLCSLVDAYTVVYLYGYGWDELWLADPNGDEIVSWEWDLGELGTAEGQWPCGEWGCEFEFYEVPSYYDPEWGDWRWSYDLPISLTVTDEAGGSTTVDAVLTLTGPAMGGGVE